MKIAIVTLMMIIYLSSTVMPMSIKKDLWDDGKEDLDQSEQLFKPKEELKYLVDSFVKYLKLVKESQLTKAQKIGYIKTLYKLKNNIIQLLQQYPILANLDLKETFGNNSDYEFKDGPNKKPFKWGKK